MLQLHLKQDLQKPSFFPLHLFAPSRVFLPLCMHVPACLFKTVSICLPSALSPKSHSRCVCVHTCWGRGQTREHPVAEPTDLSSAWSVRGPRLSDACAVSEKPRWTVQYYLDGTLVALEISKLLIFLTAFPVIHLYQRGSRKEKNVFYCAFFFFLRE